MNKLKELRKQKGLTQTQVAQYIGISQNNYSYWENGKVKIDNDSLQKLADLFDVSVDYLLGREEKKPPENQEDKNRLYVPEQYRDVMVAFQDGAENLTQEDIDAVVNFIEYMKSKKK